MAALALAACGKRGTPEPPAPAAETPGEEVE